MQGHQQIIELLNSVLRMELTGINQYFLHSKMCDGWGYQPWPRYSSKSRSKR